MKICVIGSGVTGLASVVRLLQILPLSWEIDHVPGPAMGVRALTPSPYRKGSFSVQSVPSAVRPLGLEWESGSIWNCAGVHKRSFDVEPGLAWPNANHSGDWFAQFVEWDGMHKDTTERTRALALLSAYSKLRWVERFASSDAHSFGWAIGGNVRLLESEVDVAAAEAHVQVLQDIGLGARMISKAECAQLVPAAADILASTAARGVAYHPGDGCIDGDAYFHRLRQLVHQNDRVVQTPAVSDAEYDVVLHASGEAALSNVGISHLLGQVWGWTVAIPWLECSDLFGEGDATIGFHRNILVSNGLNLRTIRAGGFLQPTNGAEEPDEQLPYEYVKKVVPASWSARLDWSRANWLAGKRLMTTHDLPLVHTSDDKNVDLVPTGHLGFTQYALVDLALLRLGLADEIPHLRPLRNQLASVWHALKPYQ